MEFLRFTILYDNSTNTYVSSDFTTLQGKDIDDGNIK